MDADGAIRRPRASDEVLNDAMVTGTHTVELTRAARRGTGKGEVGMGHIGVYVTRCHEYTVCYFIGFDGG